MTKKYLFILLAFLSFLVLTPAKINAKFRDEDNNQSNLQRNINLDEKPILRKTPPQDATPSGLMSREMNTGKDKQERQENRKEKQANFNEQAQKHSERLEFRFNKYQALFEKLLNKFKTRIEALKTEGKDTAEIETKLTALQTQLEAANSNATQAIQAFQEMKNGPLGTQKEAFENAKSLATQARNAYKEILSSFKEILALIKTLEK